LSAGQGYGFGYRLWVGFNDFTLAHYPRESIDESTALAHEMLSPSERAEVDRLDGRDRDQWFLRRALGFIASHPRRAIEYATVKVITGFSPVLSPGSGSWWRRLFYTVSYTPILALGITGVILSRAHWRELSLIGLLVASFIVVTVTAHAHTSHRSYLDVYLAILASYTLVLGWSTFLARRRPAVARGA
jgi:hypothetical protein